MQIITRDYRQFTFSFKIIFVISDHHCALPLMAIADLKIIMEMEIINIAPVVLTPLFSQKSHYRPVFRHPVIPEFCLFLSVSAQSYLALPIPSYDLLKYRSFLPFYCAFSFEFRFDFFSFLFGYCFFYYLRSVVNKVFCFF